MWDEAPAQEGAQNKRQLAQRAARCAPTMPSPWAGLHPLPNRLRRHRLSPSWVATCQLTAARTHLLLLLLGRVQHQLSHLLGLSRRQQFAGAGGLLGSVQHSTGDLLRLGLQRWRARTMALTAGRAVSSRQASSLLPPAALLCPPPPPGVHALQATPWRMAGGACPQHRTHRLVRLGLGSPQGALRSCALLERGAHAGGHLLLSPTRLAHHACKPCGAGMAALSTPAWAASMKLQVWRCCMVHGRAVASS